MKNILNVIVEYLNSDYHTAVIFVFVSLVGLIVGITKNWKAIKGSPRSEEQKKGLINVMCIILYFYFSLMISLFILITACYFMFQLNEYMRVMYLLTLIMAVITGVLFNAELIVSDIPSKQKKALVNIVLITVFTVIILSICDGRYIPCINNHLIGLLM